MKRLLRSLALRAGFHVSRVATKWGGQPVTRDELDPILPSDLAVARQVEGYTATSLARVDSLVRAVRYLTRSNIPGDIVECGVWKGGSMMAVALTLLTEGVTDRELYLFDTFEGMSQPTTHDRTANGVLPEEILRQTPKESPHGVWCAASLDEVRQNMAATGYPVERVHFIKDKVEDTVPHPHVRQISLLRLDTDWYESTKHELIHLFPLLTPGGVLVIDDYGHWLGARKAVDEYIRDHPDQPIFLSPIDSTGRIAVKVSPRVD